MQTVIADNVRKIGISRLGRKHNKLVRVLLAEIFSALAALNRLGIV
jgi:hypothetical protein